MRPSRFTSKLYFDGIVGLLRKLMITSTSIGDIYVSLFVSQEDAANTFVLVLDMRKASTVLRKIFVTMLAIYYPL